MRLVRFSTFGENHVSAMIACLLLFLLIFPQLIFPQPAAAQAEPRARELEAPGPAGPLRGTWLWPTNEAPQVLILPGSGPVDRDGFGPDGRGHAAYRLLAEGLAAANVATLRIDKRGLAGSAGAGDGYAVSLEAYAGDTRAWIEVLRRESGAPCVWLLGHSEGGLIALKTAQRPEGICGLILVGTPGRPVQQVLREQVASLPGYAPLLPDFDAVVAELEAGRQVDYADLDPHLRPLFQPVIQDYLIDLFSHDPTALAAGYGGPMLILQGGEDLQVGLADAEALAAAAPQAELTVLPAVNHVLKVPKDDSRRANHATYFDAELPLAPGVVAAIADFVRSR